MVNKIDSNVTGLKVTEEDSLGSLSTAPVWYTKEPNSYDSFGGTNSTVTREPINDTRQELRGTVTGIDVKCGWEEDLTLTNFIRDSQGFICADLLEKPDTISINSLAIPITSVANADKSYNAASGLTAFDIGHLLFASGFTIAANNGLKTVTTVAAGKITVSETLTNETPASTARLEACGYMFRSGDLGISVSGSTYTLTLLNDTSFDFTDLALHVGEWIWIGGTATNTYFASNTQGYARIVSIAADAIVFDRPTFTPATDAGAGKTVQVFFGKCARNALVAADVVMRSYTMERTLGVDGLGTGGDGVQSQVLSGCVANTFELNVTQKSKATYKVGYIGTTETFRDGDDGLLSEGDTVVGTLGEAAINTSSDVYAQRMYVHGTSTPLFAYVTDLTMSIDNGATPATAVGVLGAFDVTLGNFKVAGKATAYFATVSAPAAIRANSDVAFDTIIKVRNKSIIFDLPMVGLGGGELAVAKNEPIKLSLDTMAAKCSEGYTMGITFFPYLP